MRRPRQKREKRPRDTRHAYHVDAEGVLETFERKLFERLAPVFRKNAGIVDQHVEAANFRRRFFGRCLDALVMAYVEGENVDGTG